MPANLNDDLAQEKKDKSKDMENKNQGVNSSDYDYGHAEPVSIAKDSESHTKVANMERKDFTRCTSSSDSRILPETKETSTHEVDEACKFCTVNLEHRGSTQSNEVITDIQVPLSQNTEDAETKKPFSHQDTNNLTVSLNSIGGKDSENNSEVSTRNIENLLYTKNNESENTVQALSKDSVDHQHEEKVSEICCDAQINSQSSTTLNSSGSTNDKPGIETELSYFEQSNDETHPSETDLDSSESGTYFKDPSVPKYFNNYVDGLKVCGDSRCALDSKPSWLDIEKYRRGQKVALKYLFGIQFAQFLSLLVVLNGPGGVDPLVFTGKSDTPFKAFKRYLSTALRVKSWYVDDLWNPETEGCKNLKKVRAMHEIVRKNLQAIDPAERQKRSTLSGRCESGCPALWSTLHDKLREDFEGTCPHSKVYVDEFIKFYESRVCVNQTEMSITQFGFVGLFIKYPAYFGAHCITDEELDSFVHLWRCIGYLLGIEDKYNYCNGDLQTVLQKTTDLIEFFAKPNLRVVTQDWEHMTRCIAEGISYYVPGVSFEVSLMYLCDMLGLYTPRLWASLTFRQKIMYYLIQFTFWFMMRLPGSVDYYGRQVERTLKRGENISPIRLKELEEKKYPYQETVTSN